MGYKIRMDHLQLFQFITSPSSAHCRRVQSPIPQTLPYKTLKAIPANPLISTIFKKQVDTFASFSSFLQVFVIRITDLLYEIVEIAKESRVSGLFLDVGSKMGVLTEQHINSTGEKGVVAGQQLQLDYPVVVSIEVINVEQECLLELRRLINDDEVILNSGIELDDEFLLGFVRGKKCNSQKAFKTFQNYVNIRRVKYPSFFRNLSPRNITYLLDGKGSAGPRFCGALKYPDHEGRRLGVVKASLFDPRMHKCDHVIQAFVLAGQEILRSDLGPREGFVFIIDAAGFGFRHAREITLSRIYMILQIFLGAYPVKYKGFHILNNAYLFDTILTVVKQLLPKKLRERIHLHGSNYESLYKHVPREILPDIFGGPLQGDDAYDLAIEQNLLHKTEYYEKWATNW